MAAGPGQTSWSVSIHYDHSTDSQSADWSMNESNNQSVSHSIYWPINLSFNRCIYQSMHLNMESIFPTLWLPHVVPSIVVLVKRRHSFRPGCWHGILVQISSLWDCRWYNNGYDMLIPSTITNKMYGVFRLFCSYIPNCHQVVNAPTYHLNMNKTNLTPIATLIPYSTSPPQVIYLT